MSEHRKFACPYDDCCEDDLPPYCDECMEEWPCAASLNQGGE